MHENIQNILKMSKEERIKFGVRVADNFKEKLLKKYDYDNEFVNDFLIDVCRLFCFADNTLGINEKELFKNILCMEISDIEFLELMKDGNNEEFVNEMIAFFKELDYEDRLMGIFIGVAIMCIDNQVVDQEYNLINRLLS